MKNLMDSNCFKALDLSKQMEIFDIYMKEMQEIHVGFSMEIHWHSNYETYPTEQFYSQMVDGKTTVLFRMGMSFLCSLCDNIDAEERRNIIELIRSLGLCYQVVDDLLDLTSFEYAAKKNDNLFGVDITEGKKSLVALHHLRNSQHPEKLLSIFKKKTKDPKEIKDAIEMMRETGSLDYAEKKANELRNDCLTILDRLKMSVEAKKDVKLMIDFLIKRKI